MQLFKYFCQVAPTTEEWKIPQPTCVTCSHRRLREHVDVPVFDLGMEVSSSEEERLMLP